MNIFKRKNRVYVEYDLDRNVRILRLDIAGDALESDDLKKLGFNSGDNLTDGEIAGIVRELQNEGYDVILQKR